MASVVQLFHPGYAGKGKETEQREGTCEYTHTRAQSLTLGPNSYNSCLSEASTRGHSNHAHGTTRGFPAALNTQSLCGNAQLSFLPFKTKRAELLGTPQAQELAYISRKAVSSHRLLQIILFFLLIPGKQEAEESVFLLQWIQWEQDCVRCHPSMVFSAHVSKGFLFEI